MKKKHAVQRLEDAEGMRIPRGFEPRSLESESSVLTVTPQDQLMEVTGRVTSSLVKLRLLLFFFLFFHPAA